MKCNYCGRANYAARITFLVVTILFSFGIHAQVTDTAIVEAPAEYIDDADDDEYENDDNDYFLRRSITGGVPDSMDVRELGDSAVSKMKRDDDFWYANINFTKKKEEAAKQQRRRSSSSGDGWRILIWAIVIGGFIAFLVIYLANSNVSLFRRTKRIRVDEEDVETDDIFAIQYHKEIEKAVKAGNYRLAVRLHFLQLLRQLSDKQFIQYTQDKTNFDYLLQVNHQPWYQHFFRLTRNYEYVWYGQFEINRENFDTIKNDFASIAGKI